LPDSEFKEHYQMTTQPTTQWSSGAAEVELGLTKYLDPLRIPPVRRPHNSLEIKMRATQVQLHSQLPPTPVWTYDGHFPGPTIEVRSGRRLQVRWSNEITGAYPAPAVDVDDAKAKPGAGRDGAEPRADVKELPPWTVVHLHGARTGAGNDGWTDNAVLPGLAQLSEYENKQPSATMWYHDHGMAVTALNVYAGLAGMYLIRDDEEDALHLPDGRHEVPLVICDRNLDTDPNGDYTGELLYKRINLPLEPVSPPDTPMQDHVPAMGPFTVVNGVIWPHLDVEPRWYRFRMLNASNYRAYRFVLRDEHGTPVPKALLQIGTDSGLLPAPVELDGLTLHPGERADVLIDFRAFRGTSVTLGNTRPAGARPGTVSANPDVMQFRVGHWGPPDRFKPPATLSPSYERLDHDSLPHDHKHRWLALPYLQGKHPELWEMEEIEDPAEVPTTFPEDGIIQLEVRNDHDGTIAVKTFKRVSRDFKDAATFYVTEDTWEQWKIINLSPLPGALPHPMHVHLIRFQAIHRDLYDITTFDRSVGGTITPIKLLKDADQVPGELKPAEQGWKDTFVVNRGELVSIAGEFSGGSGRYMYHCHILEHEDEGMMRTFVVMPEKVMPFDHGPGHDPHHDH
jgi:FtsP/CotA-like multicopper oxidase with cupredoxin domain